MNFLYASEVNNVSVTNLKSATMGGRAVKKVDIRELRESRYLRFHFSPNRFLTEGLRKYQG